MQTILDFIYKILVIFRLDHKVWLVKTLMISGITLISQPVWSIFLEGFVAKSFDIEIPNSTPYGLILIALSLLIFLLNRHDLIKFDTWHTHKTSQIINLGNNKFSASFPKPMRCSPTLRFTNLPTNVIHQLEIENWNELGFTVQLPKTMKVKSIEFEANARQGPPIFWLKIKKLFD